MTGKLVIGCVVMMAVVLLVAANAAGEKGIPAALYEKPAEVKEVVTFECDPCDYNIDYGTEGREAQEQNRAKEVVKYECDPCDYNIDHGTNIPAEEK